METGKLKVLKPRIPLPRRCPDQAEYARDGETCYHAYHLDAFPAPPRAAKLIEAWHGVAYPQNQPFNAEHRIPGEWVLSQPAAMRDPDWHGSDLKSRHLCLALFNHNRNYIEWCV